jgi:hypothetical protein
MPGISLTGYGTAGFAYDALGRRTQSATGATFLCAQPSRLVKLSDNPFIPLIKARNLAANYNIEPNF